MVRACNEKTKFSGVPVLNLSSILGLGYFEIKLTTCDVGINGYLAQAITELIDVVDVT